MRSQRSYCNANEDSVAKRSRRSLEIDHLSWYLKSDSTEDLAGNGAGRGWIWRWRLLIIDVIIFRPREGGRG